MLLHGSCHVSSSHSRIARAKVSDAAVARSPRSTSGASHRGLLGTALPADPLANTLKLKSQTFSKHEGAEQSVQSQPWTPPGCSIANHAEIDCGTGCSRHRSGGAATEPSGSSPPVRLVQLNCLQHTLAFQLWSTSALGDLTSACTMGGVETCRYSRPLATSQACR